MPPTRRQSPASFASSLAVATRLKLAARHCDSETFPLCGDPPAAAAITGWRLTGPAKTRRCRRRSAYVDHAPRHDDPDPDRRHRGALPGRGRDRLRPGLGPQGRPRVRAAAQSGSSEGRDHPPRTEALAALVLDLRPAGRRGVGGLARRRDADLPGCRPLRRGLAVHQRRALPADPGHLLLLAAPADAPAAGVPVRARRPPPFAPADAVRLVLVRLGGGGA